MKTIVITSEDDKHWKRYTNFIFDSYKEAEKEENIAMINRELEKDGLLGKVYVELVGLEFFEKYQTPFI